MKKEYVYANYPIFLSPVGFKVEMCGADFSDSSVAIEFDIPDNMVHINDLDQKEVYQATVCCLKKEWITDVTSDLRLLEKKHFGSGGNNILKELRYYKEQ